MGRRGYYPGALVARVLVNRFHALRKRYFKPSNKPGRLEVVKHWFLNWEGLLLGGVFVGGLGVTAVTLYMHERVDDMRRREERCRLYEGSCMMAASHLASIQSSLVLYRVLVEVSEQRAEWQQQWQQVHQARTHLAAQQVQRWQDRTARWLGQKQLTVGGAGVQEEGEQSMQRGMAAQQQQQQQEKQQQQQQQQGKQQQQQGKQQQQQQGKQQQPGKQQQQQGKQQQQQQQQGKPQEPAETDKQQPKHQQRQQHEQHSAPPPSGQQLPDCQQQGQLVPLPQQQQQQQQQQQADVQQQSPPAQVAVGWRDPVMWYCSTRLEQAVRWLQQEQNGLALSDRGVLMWQQLGRHAAQQVVRLERQEQQQLLMLMAHTAQRAAWQGLKTYTSELEVWFDLPSFVGLASWLAQQVAVPQDGSSSSSGSSSEESTGVGSSAAAAAALGQEGGSSACTTETAVPAAAAEAGSSGGAKNVLQPLQRVASWISSSFGRRQQERNAPAETAAGAAGQPQAGVGSSSSSGDGVGGGSMQSQHWLRVRLIMPRWIPDDIEQRDWDLLCKQPQHQQQQEEKQEGASQDASAETGHWVCLSSIQPVGVDPAAAADEVDSDAGGVLTDVFEEALDVVEALWDAADG